MSTPTLPALPSDRVDAIETAVFARIADERDRRRRRRRSVWTGVGAAAAVVVVAAIVGPALGTTSGVSGSSTVAGAADSAPEGATTDQSAQGFAGSEAGSAPVAPAPAAPDQRGAAARSDASSTTAGTPREIVATGSSTVAVDDIAAAIAAIGEAAAASGGYVESSQLGDGGVVRPLEGAATGAPLSSGWITVRVPADSLTSAMDGLSAVGEVTATSVTRSDVTDQAIDLRARVAAGEASVARLTALMAQAGSVSDLIAAESALAERQAQLDSDRQILESLSSQVAMSTLTVQLTARTASVSADPAGFGDGLAAGWNGLVATLNGMVIGLGFLLPWIVVAGVTAAVVWGVRRVLRRRRGVRES